MATYQRATPCVARPRNCFESWFRMGPSHCLLRLRTVPVKGYTLFRQWPIFLNRRGCLKNRDQVFIMSSSPVPASGLTLRSEFANRKRSRADVMLLIRLMLNQGVSHEVIAGRNFLPKLL